MPSKQLLLHVILYQTDMERKTTAASNIKRGTVVVVAGTAPRHGFFRRRWLHVLPIALMIPLLVVLQYSNGSFVQKLVFIRTPTRKTASKDVYPTAEAVLRSDVAGTESVMTSAKPAHSTTQQSIEASKANSIGSFHTQRRLLIAQYAAADTPVSSSEGAPTSKTTNYYNQYLNVTSNINQAYCIRWKCDYMILRGTMDPHVHWNETLFHIERFVSNGMRIREVSTWPKRIQSLDDDDRHMDHRRRLRAVSGIASSPLPPQPSAIPESRSTYNKLAILDWALTETEYVCLLILDADAMMYDFSRDITTLLPPDRLDRKNASSAVAATPRQKAALGTVKVGTKTNGQRGALLVAHKTNRTDVAATGSINVGVTLWNVRHPLTPLLLDRWKALCLRRMWSGKVDDDQAPLQSILKDDLDANKRERVVHAISREFAYHNGLFVKHFIRPAGSTWESSHGTSAPQDRLEQMQAASRDVCTTYHPICSV